MNSTHDDAVQMIPIENINVINPRARGQHKFRQIVDNIANLGLKKPITVTPREGTNGSTKYDLVCGQGRLEAFKALGQSMVPAIVIAVGREDLLLMSLTENLARRKHRAVALTREIASLKDRGYDYSEIAKKTDLEPSYVRGIIRLLSKGERVLLQAVEKGQIPITIAITIACSDDVAVQKALAEAYESKSLRGKALLKARRLIEQRRSRGKRNATGPRGTEDLSSRQILRTYQQEMTRQRFLVSKAKICETRLLFVVTAIRSLLRDENFVNLLRAESLDTLPQQLLEPPTAQGGVQ